MLYSYARFSWPDFGYFRLSGPGLANHLFTWARFISATKRFGLIPIAPTWPQIKLGPILRNEADKRLYFRLFLDGANQIRGFRKFYLLLARPLITERELFLKAGRHGDAEGVVMFEGMDRHFSDIRYEHEFVYQELLKITRDDHKAGLEFDFRGSISLHVRLGDYNLAVAANHRNIGFGNQRVPLEWYARIVRQIRDAWGTQAPVYVFSDGRDAELRELLSLPNTRRLSFGSSIADLLALSRANILVASGSTFAMWASYLGRMPVIWRKIGLPEKLYYEKPHQEIECGDENDIPLAFFEASQHRQTLWERDRDSVAVNY